MACITAQTSFLQLKHLKDPTSLAAMAAVWVNIGQICGIDIGTILFANSASILAQRKRAGLITRRSLDRNQKMLGYRIFLNFGLCKKQNEQEEG